MSAGLNKQFLKDPLEFLESNFLCGGAKKSGVVDLDLQRMHKSSKYVYALDRDKWGFGSHKVRCYYLKAQTDMVRGHHTALIPDRIEFIFTDMLDGCQFLVYGSPERPQFEHNNNKTGKGVDFAQRLERANRMQCQASLTPEIDYVRQTGSPENCSVTGIRQPSGRWKFWVQKINGVQQVTLRPM